MNYINHDGLIYREITTDDYSEKVLVGPEHKIILDLDVTQTEGSVTIQGIAYKQRYDSSLIAITDVLKLVIGNNPLNSVNLSTSPEGLVEINLILENTTLDNVPELSFSDGIVTTNWRYEHEIK